LQSLENDNKQLDPAILEHIQAIQSLLKKQPSQLSASSQVKKSDGVSIAKWTNKDSIYHNIITS